MFSLVEKGTCCDNAIKKNNNSRLSSCHTVFHGDAPWYLRPFSSTADVPGRKGLRSALTNQLVVPPDCPPSVAELSGLSPLKYGTLYRNASYQLPRCSPSGVNVKHFSTTVFLPI